MRAQNNASGIGAYTRDTDEEQEKLSFFFAREAKKKMFVVSNDLAYEYFPLVSAAIGSVSIE